MLTKIDEKNKFLVAVGLHHRTALLESVGWDEDKLDELTKFVSSFLNEKLEENNLSSDNIANLLNAIESTWGYSARLSIKGLINFEAFNLNLPNTRSEDVN